MGRIFFLQRGSKEMRVCPQCNLPYPDNIERCVRDQSPLSALQNFIEDNAPLIRGNIIGEIVGNYKIIKKLGAGSMGTVYQASHLSIGKEVAIKILREDCAQNENILERFYQEARSLAKLNHENIVQILDFGCTSEGLAYLVTELLIGQSLDAALNKEKTFTPARAVGIASQICRGLEAAHHLKIIHRDLKPDNIHLVRFADHLEFAKLLDFGIAKQLNSNTAAAGMTKAFIGTPAYMPPEQAQETDERSDLYSLGVILYQMLVGVVPFEGSNMVDVIYKHLTEPPKPLRQIDASIPKELEDIVLRCLAKQKEQRFGSAQELQQALKTFELQPARSTSLFTEDSQIEPVDSLMQTYQSLPAATREINNDVIFHTTLSGSSGEQRAVRPKSNTLLFGAVGAVAFTGIVSGVLFSGTEAPAQASTPITAEPSTSMAPIAAKEPQSIVASQPVVASTQPKEQPVSMPNKLSTTIELNQVENKQQLIKPKEALKPLPEKKDPFGKPKGSLE
jgi:serine/threonine protein kinase